MKIIEVDIEKSEHIAAVKSLILEYFEYGNALSMKAANISFNSEEMIKEFETNAQKYTPENGGLLVLVENEGEYIGVGAYRKQMSCCGEISSEMKRVFLQDHCRGKGWGRDLVNYLINHARQSGYGSMKLESGVYMPEARALYEQLGFTEIKPYNGSECGHQGLDVLYYMELEL